MGIKPLTEFQEQCLVVKWLEAKRLTFCHVPNSGGKGPAFAVRGHRLKMAGARAGFPDLLVFDHPDNRIRRPVDTIQPACGVAIEMKTRKGGTASPEQKQWAEFLTRCGWVWFVAHGADEAIQKLEELGY